MFAFNLFFTFFSQIVWTGANRDAIVEAGGLPHIFNLLSSQKEHSLKMTSYALSLMTVDGNFRFYNDERTGVLFIGIMTNVALFFRSVE